MSKQFGASAPAIEHVNLTIQPGEFLTLLGPSGSGKTTALNLLAGFMKPTSGRILIDGKVVSDLPAHKRNVGVVFQHYALFPHLNVRENIAYPLKQRGVARAEIAQRVDSALRTVALRRIRIGCQINFPADSSNAWRLQGRRCSIQVCF